MPSSSSESSDGGLDIVATLTTVTVIESLVFEVAGSRYCNNIGRAHASNGVKMTVDLKRGVVFQTCWDLVSCSRYRSPAVEVPPELLPMTLPLWK